MKRIFTLLIAFVVSMSAFAFPNSTRLTITTFKNQSITVMIDGRAAQFRQHDDTYTISNLSAGNHSVKILRQRRNNGRWTGNNVIFSGTINIRRGYHTDIVINRFGKAFIDQELMDNDRDRDGRDRDDRDRDDRDRVMDNYSFEQLKQVIAKESFDNTRMNIAKSNISRNMFSAAQAKQLIQLFTFETGKLEIAKYLYRYTADKNNYFIVYDVFSYSSSKDELSSYIQQYR